MIYIKRMTLNEIGIQLVSLVVPLRLAILKASGTACGQYRVAETSATRTQSLGTIHTSSYICYKALKYS